MAAIEFVGYSISEIAYLKQKMIPILMQLEFAHHIVFIETNVTQTCKKVDGSAIQYINFFTRSKQRGELLSKLFAPLFISKIIYIGISVINGEVFDFTKATED